MPARRSTTNGDACRARSSRWRSGTSSGTACTRLYRTQLAVCGDNAPASPPYRGAMTADRLLIGLDPDQRRAVQSPAAPLASVAAPGSGKTTVLTRRIAFRLEHRDAQPRHVVALT